MEQEEDKVIIDSFTKVYSIRGKSVIACSNINLKAEKGAIVGIIGPNGAGKSSLLKSLCGMQYPSSGTINIYGCTNLADIRNITGFVPEVPVLDTFFTVKELLYQEAVLHGMDNASSKRAVNRVSKLLLLDEALNKKTSVLSKGFVQRVSLAKALIFNPKLLVLDEFSGGLDPAQIASVKDILRDFSKKGIIFFSTHHIEEVVSLCTYLYIIDKGNIVAHGTVSDVIDNSGKKSLEEAYLWYANNQ